MKRYEDIRQWASDRNLIEGSDPVSQFLKTLSEFGELADGVNKNRIIEIKDGIGDVKVTLVIIAKQLGFNLEDEMPVSFDLKMKTAKNMVLVSAVLIGLIAEDLAANNLGDGRPNESIVFAIQQLDRELDVLAKICELTPEECIEHAWNEIKDRKGRMVDGVFIKEGDVEKVQS